MFGEYDFLNIQPKGGKVKTPVEIAQDEVKKGIFEDLTSRLGLSSLLDLPLVALSNGQTHRARIVKAILSEPELLVLDEPLTGLDVNTRPILLNVFRSLHDSHIPRILMGLRMQDPVPDWISHIALVTGETILTGVKDEIMSKYADYYAKEAEHRMASTTQSYLQSGLDHGKPVVDTKNVKVSYGFELLGLIPFLSDLAQVLLSSSLQETFSEHDIRYDHQGQLSTCLDTGLWCTEMAQKLGTLQVNSFRGILRVAGSTQIQNRIPTPPPGDYELR
ncbi:uncharacterized protein EDB93DRAFT_1219272 [Suillus bovinus]|uniref:uncharacterized protein n=1 Tax=Suillus bovinus TaxID=48563 RepID=UPI001B87F2C7|nr:uncharacterized protein EDB93DRAFT_1219272 [Suillus bovinus]KAG2158708.1 hypothetical protein EDB93DRAFT_1219272 [Suillus bovinus]